MCFFVHQAAEVLDPRAFEEGYGEKGQPAYHPVLMLKVWLYACALQVTSSWRLARAA